MLNICSLMETNRLKQLQVLSETRNLRKAAEILNISHTGLHKSLHKLETELNQSLFYIVGRGLELTPYAFQVFQKIPQILNDIESLQGTVLHASLRPMTIGSFEVFTTYAFPVLAKNLDQFSFRLCELGPGKLEDAILQGTVDLGITYSPIARAGLEIIPVGKISMGVYHRLGAFENVSMKDLPFAAPTPPLDAAPTLIRGLDGWPDHKVQRKIVYSVEMMETALALLREGMAVAYLPKFVVRLQNQKLEKKFQLVERHLTETFPAQIKKAYLVKGKHRKEDSVERQVARTIRALVSS